MPDADATPDREGYEHTQTGWIALLGLAALPLAWLDPAPTTVPLLSEAAVRVVAAGVILMVTVVFSRLTVRVGAGRLTWHFGLGLLGGSVRLSEIRRAEVVENPMWYGWGLRLTPAGRLYSVGGRRAVAIETVAGRRLRIGTDEPGRLLAALEDFPRNDGRGER